MSSNDKRDDLDAQSGEPEGVEASATDNPQTDAPADAPVEDAEIVSDDSDRAADGEAQELTVETQPTDAEATSAPASEEPATAQLDTTPEPSAEPTQPDPSPAAPVAAAPKRGGGFVSGLVGGVAAAAVGFGAAQFLEIDWLNISGGEDPVATELAEQSTALQQQAEAIATLQGRLAELSEAVAAPDTSALETTITDLAGQLESDVGQLSTGVIAQLGQVTETVSGLANLVGTLEGRVEGVDTRLGSLDSGLAAVTDGLSGVDERLVAVEKRPLVESSETARATYEAYEREVQRLTASLEAQKTESADAAKRMAELAALTEAQISAVQTEAAERLAAMQAEATEQIARAEAEKAQELEAAESSIQTAAITAALIDLEKALEDGTPYAAALATLGGSTEIPQALASYADAGVETLAALRQSYPVSARAALDASLRAGSGDADAVGKLTSFLRAQTGARSLAPKDGDDPDAVLSRAEVAVKAGDLSGAVTELAALPDAGQAAIADWIASASARVDAVAAAEELSAAFPTN